MRIAVTSEYHFRRGPDGVYTDAAYPHRFWDGLREIFEEIVVLARVGDEPVAPGHQRADGPGVRFAEIPEFVGARGMVVKGGALLAASMAAAADADVLLLRAPGVIATAGYAGAILRGRPYAIEVVGDPAESLAHAGKALALLAAAGAHALRAQVRGAIAARYVTQHALQALYPPPSGRFTIAASDLELPDALFAEAPIAIAPGALLSLIFVGPLARSYKGVDVLIEALARTARPHRLTIVGDGVLRAALFDAALARGLGERVSFTGMLPAGAPVIEALRAADLFVLPSRTEGLPRALIEAMAVGLPCLATPVGGVPELLGPAALVPVDDPAALARAIDALAEDPDRRHALAAANRARAAGFRSSLRRARMHEFYRAIRTAAGEPRRRV